MYCIYWTDGIDPRSTTVFELTEALQISESKRKSGHRFVTMVSENPNQVGGSGVDSVVDGKLPDGSDYTWKMRRHNERV